MLGGLWYFWPSTTITPLPPATVVLGEELQPWFEHAQTTEFLPSRFLVELTVRPSYLKTLTDVSRTVQLSYRLLGRTGVLFHGTTPCPLDPSKVKPTIVLPNPKRVAATHIELYLAR